jgi:hypothetical protein
MSAVTTPPASEARTPDAGDDHGTQRGDAFDVPGAALLQTIK